MSRFIEKLNRISQPGSQQMGFKAAKPASQKPKMLIIASLAQDNIKSLTDYVAGADAGLLHISELNSGAETLQKLSQVVPDIPWGGWLRDSNQGGMEQLVKAGCDFVVFPATNTPLALLQDNETGKILEVAPSLSDGLLRAVNALPLDALLIAPEERGSSILTWHHLMLFQHFADLLTKPLLVSIPSNVTAVELHALWEAGVDAVIIEIRVGQPVDRLKEVCQMIDKLAVPSRRKRRKAAALLPRIGGETNIVVEEE